MNRPGLGRGLGALIPSAAPGRSGLVDVALSRLQPNRRQPRGAFDDVPLAELAQSLREVGMLQPIIARPLDSERFEIVAGERRFRAARLAGLETVPVIVRHTGDDALLTEALVENVHRADLNPLEEAAAYQQLLDDFGLTHEQLAQRVGKSRSAISNALRLLALPPSVQQHLASGRLSAGHARALLSLENRARLTRSAEQVVDEGMSVRATEELVRRATAPPPTGDKRTSGAGSQRSPYGHLERRLGDALATRVQIRGSDRRGRVVIDYAGEEDLARLLQVLSRGIGECLDREA